MRWSLSSRAPRQRGHLRVRVCKHVDRLQDGVDFTEVKPDCAGSRSLWGFRLGGRLGSLLERENVFSVLAMQVRVRYGSFWHRIAAVQARFCSRLLHESERASTMDLRKRFLDPSYPSDLQGGVQGPTWLGLEFTDREA